MVCKHPRPNIYTDSAELSQRLTLNAMTPRPEPMSKPVGLWKDLSPLDRKTYLVWIVALVGYFVWLAHIW